MRNSRSISAKFLRFGMCGLEDFLRLTPLTRKSRDRESSLSGASDAGAQSPHRAKTARRGPPIRPRSFTPSCSRRTTGGSTLLTFFYPGIQSVDSREGRAIPPFASQRMVRHLSGIRCLRQNPVRYCKPLHCLFEVCDCLAHERSPLCVCDCEGLPLYPTEASRTRLHSARLIARKKEAWPASARVSSGGYSPFHGPGKSG
jgi:hypothetical protein